MGNGFSKMKKQMKAAQEQYAKMQEELEKKEVMGKAPNDLVTIVMNGEKKLKSIHISPECVDPEDIEGLQDLILAAFEDASNKLEEETQSPLGNFSLPF